MVKLSATEKKVSIDIIDSWPGKRINERRFKLPVCVVGNILSLEWRVDIDGGKGKTQEKSRVVKLRRGDQVALSCRGVSE